MKKILLALIVLVLAFAAYSYLFAEKTEAPVNEDKEPDGTACTLEAKICPDGTAVGRTGPNCEFEECPQEANPKPVAGVECKPEQRNVDACTAVYQPVCGQVQVECITAPCNPVPETFSNACQACSNSRVLSYTEGEC